MESKIKKLQNLSKKKGLKTEMTSFKLTMERKKQLTAIRDTYGKSYGVLLNLMIEQVYKSMLTDEYTKNLNNAKQLKGLSEDTLSVIKHDNPEARKVFDGLIKELTKRKSKLDKMQTELEKHREFIWLELLPDILDQEDSDIDIEGTYEQFIEERDRRINERKNNLPETIIKGIGDFQKKTEELKLVI